MKGDVAAVRTLLKDGADVNAVQGDGVTGLHWAARHGDAELATHADRGRRQRAGDDPLRRHHAAAPGRRARLRPDRHRAGQGRRRGRRPHQHRRDAADVRRRLGRHRGRSPRSLDAGADVDAKETDREQTPLIFAAAANRVEAVKLLIANGANKNAMTKVIDLMALSANGENPDGRNLAAKPETRQRRGGARRRAADRRRRPAGAHAGPGPRLPDQRAGAHPGRHDAAALRRPPGLHRRGRGAARRRRRRQPEEGRRPRVGAAHRDHQRPLRPGERCCSTAAPTRTWSPRTASAPLYAAINLMWAPRAGYPQPRAHLNQTHRLPRLHEEAAREGRRPQRPGQQEGVVLELQLRPVGGRGDRFDGVLARRLRRRRRRDEAADGLRRRPADPDRQAARARRVRRRRPPRDRRRVGRAAGAGGRPGHPDRCWPRPASATARASPATRIATPPAACWPG